MHRNEIGNLKSNLIRSAEYYYNAEYIPFSDIMNKFGEKENRYFDFLMPKLRFPIGFFLKKDLTASMRNAYLPGECNIIFMKEIPGNEISLLEVCHELGHIYLVTNGYPYISGNDNIPDFYKTITTNVIHDPIINKMLFDFKMDVIGYMRKGIHEQLIQILRCNDEKKLSTLDRHYMKCLLIEKLQEWKIIKNTIPNSFEIVSKERIPGILSESKEFVKRIDVIGTRKPKKCRMLFEELISQSGITDSLKVIDINEAE